MVRWLRWHCPPDTGYEIRALAVWGRARYLSVTEASHNTDFHTWMGKKYFCSFQTAETGNRTPNSGVKGSGANHHPRAPALTNWHQMRTARKYLYVATSSEKTIRSVAIPITYRLSHATVPPGEWLVGKLELPRILQPILELLKLNEWKELTQKFMMTSKWKKTLLLMVYPKIYLRCSG